MGEMSKAEANEVMRQWKDGERCLDCKKQFLRGHGQAVVCARCWPKSDKLCPKAIYEIGGAVC